MSDAPNTAKDFPPIDVSSSRFSYPAPLPAMYGVKGYEDLCRTLSAAYDQATKGKGSERHADGKPFTDQPIMTITRRRGVGFPLGQIEKKSDEADGMIRRGEYGAAIRELHGVMVYAAALAIRIAEIERLEKEGSK
ncbi:hypothetical protein U0C82_03840 [Fulvimarina sp. 2208YS6-2-32]|uniref:dATP/dGTP diphosphohydrolase N-terminal domain-containing protein n=1 Tax=Fulvimarina uroteuthidis TaxID=3098149 RepID=A0ABU5HZ92_9HYPH|nr:hypothetical protein [Fulvimarina sp. 2208YS6-2-32]MDY8108281.1 hypothetical protein [Fulvimarina sp. 2208YS6-2-32]